MILAYPSADAVGASPGGDDGIDWISAGTTVRATGATSTGYQVVRSYPHDRQAFTQGLVYRDGVFYEGTGLNGRSASGK